MSSDTIVKVRKEWLCVKGIIIALAVIAVAASVGAVVVGVLGYQGFGRFTSPQSFVNAQPLPPSPYAFYLDNAVVPMAMALPNDLTPYIGVVMRVVSLTAQTHSITIQGTGSTWDGTHSVATFGGAIGDGIMFEAISATRITVWSTVDVTFS